MKVRAKTAVFVNNHYRYEGDVFEYSGPPNRHLESLEPEPVVAPVKEPEAPKKWSPKAKHDSDAG